MFSVHNIEIGELRLKGAPTPTPTTKKSANNLILNGHWSSFQNILVYKSPNRGGGFRLLAHGLVVFMWEGGGIPIDYAAVELL